MGVTNLDVEKFLVEFEILKNQIRKSLYNFESDSVIFADSSRNLAESSNLKWDDDTKLLTVSGDSGTIPTLTAQTVAAFVNSSATDDDVRISLIAGIAGLCDINIPILLRFLRKLITN